MMKSPSLFELSSRRIAERIWKDSEVKKIFIPLITPNKFGVDCTVQEAMRKNLVTTVRRRIKSLKLPVPVRNHIFSVMSSMGILIKKYMEDLVMDKDMNRLGVGTLLDHISWTPSGTIDKGATIRSLVKYLPKTYETWVKLASHCLVDMIKDFNVSPGLMYNHMIRAKCSFWASRDMESVLALYWYGKNGGSHSVLVELFMAEMYDDLYYQEKFSIEENMLAFSFVYCNYEGVKYFWSVLNDEQRERSIINIIGQNNRRLFESGNCHDIDLVNFLLEKAEFYKLDYYWIGMLKQTESLNIFLKLPQLHSFMEIYEQAITLKSPINLEKIFLEIITNIKIRAEFFGFEDVYEDLFHKLWKNLPREKKQRINVTQIISTLVVLPRMDLLKLIIYDEQLVENRGELLWYLMEMISAVYVPDDELPLEFSEKVLRTEEIREIFEMMITREKESGRRNYSILKLARRQVIGHSDLY